MSYAQPAAAGPAARQRPMLPRPFRVRWARQDTADTVTLALEPAGGEIGRAHV